MCIRDRPCDGQYLLHPSPLSSRTRVSIAHAVISTHNHRSQCKLLNPTNAPASLSKRTVLATITAIPDYQHMSIGMLWIYRLLFVCLFVFFVSLSAGLW